MEVVEKENYEQYRGVAEDLLEQTDSITLLSAALKMLTKEPIQKPTLLPDQLSRRNNRKYRGKSGRGRKGGRNYNKKKR